MSAANMMNEFCVGVASRVYRRVLFNNKKNRCRIFFLFNFNKTNDKQRRQAAEDGRMSSGKRARLKAAS